MNGNEVVSTASENPFRVQRVRPGAIPYIFPTGQSVETLVDRLRQAGWWGEVVGPHGSGKSTLLETLTIALDCAGHLTVLVALHDRQRRLPMDLSSDGRLRAPAILVIDGYEQLGRLNRWTVKRFCRRHDVGLLVTAHESVGLPDLFRTSVTPSVAEQVIGQLLEGLPPPFRVEEVSKCLAKNGGDLRETLFDLYDIYEQCRPGSSPGASSGQIVT